jgi:hypothetical protein
MLVRTTMLPLVYIQVLNPIDMHTFAVLFAANSLQSTSLRYLRPPAGARIYNQLL